MLRVGVDPGGVGQGGMGTCSGCVTSYEALGGARLPHSPVPLWYLLVTILLARNPSPL